MANADQTSVCSQSVAQHYFTSVMVISYHRVPVINLRCMLASEVRVWIGLVTDLVHEKHWYHPLLPSSFTWKISLNIFLHFKWNNNIQESLRGNGDISTSVVMCSMLCQLLCMFFLKKSIIWTDKKCYTFYITNFDLLVPKQSHGNTVLVGAAVEGMLVPFL